MVEQKALVRDVFYQQIIAQLLHDGHTQLATSMQTHMNLQSLPPPSNKLFQLVEKHGSEPAPEGAADTVDTSKSGTLDFDETMCGPLAPELKKYECLFTTSHKAPCRALACHPSGTLFATGSEDASIKILDVDRMISRGDAFPQEGREQLETHPVIRTLYDHTLEVTCIAFHPTEQVLVSGSSDYTIKFFDYSKPASRKAVKSVHEASELRTIAMHPSGQFVLAGCQHPTIRIYDINSLQCFVSPEPNDQHIGPINSLAYTQSGGMFASTSKDGAIHLWDGTSCRCVYKFQKAHNAEHVTSAYFSRNGKYLLSAGKDSIVRLWDVRTRNMLLQYTGAGSTGRMTRRIQAVFNNTEDYVILPDEKTGCLCSWETRTAKRMDLLSLGHTQIIRQVAHSSLLPAFVTCSEDWRARFWYRKSFTD